MENSLKEEVLLSIKKNLKLYLEWLKPKSGDPLGLAIVKSFFKAITTSILIAFSPILLLILTVAFLSAI